MILLKSLLLSSPFALDLQTRWYAHSQHHRITKFPLPPYSDKVTAYSANNLTISCFMSLYMRCKAWHIRLRNFAVVHRNYHVYDLRLGTRRWNDILLRVIWKNSVLGMRFLMISDIYYYEQLCRKIILHRFPLQVTTLSYTETNVIITATISENREKVINIPSE
jgi:hypothetical protein